MVPFSTSTEDVKKVFANDITDALPATQVLQFANSWFTSDELDFSSLKRIERIEDVSIPKGFKTPLGKEKETT